MKKLHGIDELRAQTEGDPRICIAVLDGPVDLAHPVLAAAHLEQLPTVAMPHPGGEDAGGSEHGTHVASILFGRGEVAGIAPDCRGVVLPIYPAVDPAAEDGGLAPCSELDMARALTQAVETGAQVINVSGGQPTASGTAHPLLAEAMRLCAERNVLVVAAAGNQGCDCLLLPAALPSVLAVGALGDSGEPLGFSNWGASYRQHGILAPGEDVPGAVPGGGVAAWSGTSYATPIVSGVAALLLSLQLERGEAPDPRAVRRAILDGAQPCEPNAVSDCRTFLAGVLDVAEASRRLTRISNPNTDERGNEVEDQIRPEEELPGKTLADPVAEATADDERPAGAEKRAEAERTPPLPAAVVAAAPPAVAGTGAIATAADAAAVWPAGGPAQKVYAIATLDYDFGTQARRDSLEQGLNGAGNPADPRALLAHFETHPWEASSVLWILRLDATPIYAVRPGGAFAAATYDRLRAFLKEQLEEGVERVAIPGHLSGTVRLLDQQEIPVLWPELRGMASWSTDALVEAVCGQRPDGEQEAESYDQTVAGVRNFLQRVYYELRNLGVSAGQRALNFAVTNAFQSHAVFEQAADDGLELDTIDTELSPICRPGSECWDVKLVFFDPGNRLERARKVYRFTVDVSDVVPVTVGEVRSWSIY